MQASEQVARLDARLEEERRNDGLEPFLKEWRDASCAFRSSFGSSKSDLEREGASRERLAQVEERVQDLQRRLAKFDVKADLDECAGAWDQLARDVAALSGPRREELLGLLTSRKAGIDRATAGLSKARSAGGAHPDQRARLQALEAERARERERQARLRDDYLRASRGRGAALPPAAIAPLVVRLPGLLSPRSLVHDGDRRLQ
ncbi:MAG TPA: hypothetical protein VE964_00900, partial [Myxococcales bacterium]|nr:hypothetical protein [Myxococcales bacterium]